MKKSSRYGKFAVYIAVVVLVNIVASTLFFRFDLTGAKVYSLSKVSREVVSNLHEPLTINVFFTRNLPAPYNTVEQYLKDLLGEYGLYANRNFNYRFYDVSAEGEIDAGRTEKNRRLAGDYGINPVQIQVLEKDEMKFKKAYMGLVIIHGDMVERIPTITSPDGLEYKLTTAIQRLGNKVSALLALKDKVKVTLYISPSMDTVAPRMGVKDLAGVPEAVKKVVQDLNARMFGKLDYTMAAPRTEEEMAALSKKYSIMTLKWGPLDDGRIPAGTGVIGLVAEYGDKSIMIPVLQAFNIPLFGTQYKLTDQESLKDAVEQSVESLVNINETLGYLADKGTLNPYGQPGAPGGLNNFNNLASRTYSIKEITLGKGIPSGLGCLLIVRPTEQLSDYDLYQIDQALMQGTNLAVFYDPFMEAAPPGMQSPQQQQLAPVVTGLEKLLEHYGVKVNQSLVLDEKCFKQRLPEQYGGGEQTIYYAPIIEGAQINGELPYMRNIKELITYKIAPLAIDTERIRQNGLTVHTLFSSSDKSWEMKGQIVLNPMFIRPPEDGAVMAARPLACIIEGSFPSYFAGKPMPEKPAEKAVDASGAGKKAETPAPSPQAAAPLEHKGDFRAVSKPARIFLIGSSEMITDNLISDTGDNTNTTFIMNVIDVLNNKEDLALMRSKVQAFNPLQVQGEGMKIAARVFNIAGLPLIVVLSGLFVWLRRLARRKRIEAAFSTRGDA